MNERGSEKGIMVVVSGPSGVGKTTICKGVAERIEDVYVNVSVTTRVKGENEIDGQDYWFISREQFEERIAKELFLEYAEVFGNLYGTPRDKIEEALEAGKVVILEIDVQGSKQVKVMYPEAVMIFILPPSQSELKERIDSRGRDEIAAIEERLGGAGTEVAAGWQYYQHMVINDDLQQAINEVVQIIQQNIGDRE